MKLKSFKNDSFQTDGMKLKTWLCPHVPVLARGFLFFFLSFLSLFLSLFLFGGLCFRFRVAIRLSVFPLPPLPK